MNFKLFTCSASLMITLAGGLAAAQATTPQPTPDPYPYQSQIMLRYLDGTLQTIPAFTTNFSLKVPGELQPRPMPNSAMLYDIENPYTGVSSMGANWGFFQSDEGDSLVTISAGGRLWSWGVKSYSPVVKGGVYFLKAGSTELVTVSSIGNTFETGENVGMPRLVGGNFFIKEDRSLVTISSNGNYNTWKGLDWVAQAKRVGGNYFEKSDGAIVGVSSIDGMLDSRVPAAPAKWLGGNYFIGTDNVLYTITNKGVLTRDPEFTFSERPVLLGYSFLKNADGTIVYIDGLGAAHRSLIRVWPAAMKSMPVFQLKTDLDQNGIYLPGFNR